MNLRQANKVFVNQLKDLIEHQNLFAEKNDYERGYLDALKRVHDLAFIFRLDKNVE